ncbi:DUF4062 domain-containing protein [Clostridium psychrophilum]|uniref:DUF4062 domain-containing protein n=1 Tax=Clostridium psychrophilum TaxID=132926 RepID=UPI001C0E2684|nr:DUF4062 domain-containing protein [Clostridium psychrophilum]MBU3181131.1 DUF4062 domain-containing protein [Clostridium psychrophilum]
MKKKLQVFVSSTYEDLVEERQTAVQAILNAGHIPAGMELFTSGDESQKDTIKKWIDESDVYFLILGGRYGTIDKSTGKSYTQWEYEYAGKVGKPRFAVVITEDALEKKVRAKGTKMMEKDNPLLCKEFRDEVLSKVCKFYDDTKDIQLVIFQKLAEYADDEALVGWVYGKEFISSEELLKINEENRMLRDENEKLKKDLKSRSKEISIDKISFYSKQFESRTQRILKLLNYEEIYGIILWCESEDDEVEINFEVENILEKFSPYFEYKEKTNKEFGSINFVCVDDDKNNLNLANILGDIRLQLEHIPDKSEMDFKFIIISNRIDVINKDKTYSYFDNMVGKVDSCIKDRVCFEIWDDGKLNEIEEIFGINFIESSILV